MSRSRAGVLWELRDDRTLSEHAKIAYLMLWSRGANIWPSLKTLGADMGASRATAKRAVQELERVGLVKKIPRMRASGEHDSNSYELLPLPEGWGQTDPTSVQQDPTGGVRQTPEDGNLKTASEGRNPLASRRARPAAERADKIAFARRAVMISYSAQDADEDNLTDSQAVALWYLLVSDRNPKDPVAYLCKIFEDTPYLDTHLANAGTEEDWE